MDMVDKDRNDSTFKTFCESMLDLSFQEIASEVPYARWLLDEADVTTTASQQFVSIPSDMDIDALVGARVAGDDRFLHRISPKDADRIDPGRDLTGEEILYWFQRVGGVDRLYFLHKPDSVDTVTFIFGNTVDDPASAASYPLPAKYESTLIHLALIKVWERIDPTHDTSKHERMAQAGMARIYKDANSAPDQNDELTSHRPRMGSGISGPRFPSNFDTLP